MPPESLYRFRTNRRCLALKRGRDVAARVLISDADADTDTDTDTNADTETYTGTYI